MAIQLHLTAGDKVRNIRANSSRNGLVGFVEKVQRDTKRGDKYLVKWSTGAYGTYFVELAHHSIEAVVDPKEARQEQKAISFFQRYHGQPMVLGTAYRDVSMMNTDDRSCVLRAFTLVTGQQLESKRRTIKKERRNVITGRTQSDSIRDLGHARGIQQFNTRAIGLSTGQAMARIADAIMHPGKAVRVWDVDHAITDPKVKAGRGELNKTFVALVQSLIQRNEFVGITFDMPKQYMTFNPIVTEETYVETY